MATEKNNRNVGRHRAADLPVRRWLQLGAASAGMGAALLGWSLVGSETGVAAADGVDASSASAGPAASPSRGVDSGSSSRAATATATPRTATSREGADSSGPSTASRRVARAAAAENDDDAPSHVVSRANRAAAAESSSVADRLTNATNIDSRVASRAAAPNGSPFTAVQNAFTPPVNTAQPAAAPGGNVTWKFVYTKGAENWTPERRRALEESATALGSYFDAPVPVTLTYEVVGDPTAELLGSASSPRSSEKLGFESSVAQEKFLSGLDLNGPGYDGQVTFYFGNKWGYGPKVPDSDWDFVSTAMHELAHTIGFGSDIPEPGKPGNGEYTLFDQFVVDDRGNHPIGPAPGYRFDTGFNSDLVGLTGMYFAGPHAVAEYGKPVPLWTPYPFIGGTSLSHLDSNTFSGPENYRMMNHEGNKTGNDRRFLSAIEQGIFADLGFRVFFQDPAPYAPRIG